jgi:hypothetical protein
MDLAKFMRVDAEIRDYIKANDRNALEKYRSGTHERDELDELKANAEGQNAREINNLLNMIDRYLSNDEFIDDSPSKVDITHYSKRKVLDLLKRLKPMLRLASNKLDENDKLKNYSSMESYEKMLNSFNTPIKSLKTSKRYVESSHWDDKHNTNSKESVLANIESDLETIHQLKARVKKIIRRLNRGYTSSSSRKSRSSSKRSRSSSRKTTSSRKTIPPSRYSPNSPDFPPPSRRHFSPHSPPPPSPRTPSVEPPPLSPNARGYRKSSRRRTGTRRRRQRRSKKSIIWQYLS